MEQKFDPLNDSITLSASYSLFKPFSVAENLSKKWVLLTGVTGFIGKVVLEKLIREISDIHVFVLIRGENPQQRFAEILATDLFSGLKALHKGQEFDDLIAKTCVAVSGDMKSENLGLSKEDLATIQSKVNVVVHCAASTDFRTGLREALDINMLGSLRLLEMAKTWSQIEGFVYVSTTYCQDQPSKTPFPEALAKINFDPLKVLEIIQNTKDDKELAAKLNEWNKVYVNNYSFTKALTEHCLTLKRDKLPFVIVRPSCVGASIKEPFPGWVDSKGALGGVILSSGVNVLSVLKGEADVVGDVIPVDVVSNVIVAATSYLIGKDQSFRVYQVGSSTVSPVYWKWTAKWMVRYWNQFPTDKRVIKGKTQLEYVPPPQYEVKYFMKFKVPQSLLSVGGLGNEVFIVYKLTHYK
jgi:thioester reductase-like protein